MEKLFRGIQPIIVEVDDVENISQAVLNDLEIGDMVVLYSHSSQERYIVHYKNNVELYFVYTDSSVVKEVYYSKDELTNLWSYQETTTTDLDTSNKPSVFFDSNGFDGLQELLPNLKVGDIIYNPDDKESAIVYSKSARACSIYDVFNSNQYSYFLDDDNEWQFEEMTPIYHGTKLFKHIISFSDADEMYFTSKDGNAFNKAKLLGATIDDFIQLAYYYDGTSDTGLVLQYYPNETDEEITITFYSADAESLQTITRTLTGTISDEVIPL